MKITYLGHAGLMIETQNGSILCDPWFTPAYFASWFPFPDNSSLLEREYFPDYLYISHLHQDHFDKHFLYSKVWKKAVVLLPDYPVPLLERTLREIGFTRFHQMCHGRWQDIHGLRCMCLTTVSPSDGPLGDSALVVDDGHTRILNQNDARPRDLSSLLEDERGIDAHFLQFSGAIWYPLVYDYSPKIMQALGKKKRENEMARALRYIEQVGATHVFPSSGPACFLDDHLYHFNDFNNDPTNTFPDQLTFLQYMCEHGQRQGHLIVPECSLSFESSRCHIEYPLPEEAIRRDIFEHKRTYLEFYRHRKMPYIQTHLVSLQQKLDIIAHLQMWFEPLMKQATVISSGIGGTVVIDWDEGAVALDFEEKCVRSWHGEAWRYYFHMKRAYIDYCIVSQCEDWVNALFLSFRFTAKRKGVFNEFVYVFFKCLSSERMCFAENYYAQVHQTRQGTFEQHGYSLQKFCPHGGADLSIYGKFDLDQHILTCQVHDWQFDLRTGACLSSASPIHRLAVQPTVNVQSLQENVISPTLSNAELHNQCHHCWFRPSHNHLDTAL